jgi:hypothetical protein
VLRHPTLVRPRGRVPRVPRGGQRWLLSQQSIGWSRTSHKNGDYRYDDIEPRLSDMNVTETHAKSNVTINIGYVRARHEPWNRSHTKARRSCRASTFAASAAGSTRAIAMRVRLLALALIALCCAPLEVAASSNYMRCAPHPVPPMLDPRMPTPDVRRRRRGRVRGFVSESSALTSPPAPSPTVAGGFAPTTTAL